MDITPYLSPALSIYDRIDKWKSLKNNVESQIRLIYIECRKNMALLEIVKEEKGYKDEEIIKIIGKLNIEITESIFCPGEGNKKLFKKLSKKIKVKIPNDIEGQLPFSYSPEEYNIYKTLLTIYLKIYSVQLFAELKKEKVENLKILFSVRLKNIKDLLHLVITEMRKLDEIKGMEDGKVLKKSRKPIKTNSKIKS